MTFNATTIDPVTTEVVASRLRETAATMEYALYHSGYSPILRESKDGTAGLTDPEGRVVIISGGLQYHFTAYQQAVQAVLARYPAAGLKPGESFVSNDPYKCGSPHAPDFVAVTPAFHQGVLTRLRREFRAQVRHRRPGTGLVRRCRARDLSRWPAAAAGALPDPGRHRGVDRSDHRQQQPGGRRGARRSAGASRLHAARRRAARGAMRGIRPRHGS